MGEGGKRAARRGDEGEGGKRKGFEGGRRSGEMTEWRVWWDEER